MKLWRVTNQIKSSVVIEDIGVRLDPGAYRVIDDSTKFASSDLKRLEHAGTVSVSLAAVDLHMRQVPARIWPLSRPRPTSADPAPPDSAPTSDRPSLPPASDVDSLRETVRDLEAVVRSLTSAISLHAARPPEPAAVHPDQPRPARPAALEPEPVFIPSQIIPDADTSNMRVQAEHSDASEFEDAAAALKSARKKGPAR